MALDFDYAFESTNVQDNYRRDEDFVTRKELENKNKILSGANKVNNQRGIYFSKTNPAHFMNKESMARGKMDYESKRMHNGSMAFRNKASMFTKSNTGLLNNKKDVMSNNTSKRFLRRFI